MNLNPFGRRGFLALAAIFAGSKLLVGATPSCLPLAPEKLKPLNVWIGISLDDSKQSVAPENGLIIQQKEFESLWKSWHPGEPLPAIDFESDFVLVSTVNGPNRMRLGKLVVSKEDVGETVVFRPISTKRGGAGFGHILVQVPRRNITSVNGAELPASGEEFADGVEVNIVGIVQTGIMAIGGESTGTMITAGNITWELALDESNAGENPFEAFNGKRARVLGRLTKQQGVEIAERWIVNVEEIRDPELRPVKKEKLDAFTSITVTQSGGIAGYMNTTKLIANGLLSKQVQFGDNNPTNQMPHERLSMLHQLVRETNWKEVPARTRNARIADGFQFDITLVVNNGKNLTYTIDESSLSQVGPLQQLINLFMN